MGNVKRKSFTQRKVTRVSNVVWEMLKCCVATLEDEDDDLDDNNFLYATNKSIRVYF
jgi:hypothetical protein